MVRHRRCMTGVGEIESEKLSVTAVATVWRGAPVDVEVEERATPTQATTLSEGVIALVA